MEIVKELLEWGADLEAKDKDGFTALTYAAAVKDKEVVEELLNRGHHLQIYGRITD